MDWFTDNWVSLVPLLIPPVMPTAMRWIAARFRLSLSRMLPSRRLIIAPLARSNHVARSGRVPLQLYRRLNKKDPELRAHSVFLFKRPSSPKPAFAITEWAIVAADSRIEPSSRLSPGHTVLEFVLHQNEDSGHFKRSFRRIGRNLRCKIAIVSPQYMDDRSRPVVVATASLSPESITSEHESIVLNIGERKQVVVDQTSRPKKMIWLVKTDPASSHDPVVESFREGWRRFALANRGRTTIRQMDQPPQRFVLTREPWINRAVRVLTILLSITLGALVLVLDWAVESESSSWPSIVFVWILTALYAARHGYLVLRHESYRDGWVGGTTGCVRDGDILHAGRGDVWDVI